MKPTAASDAGPCIKRRLLERVADSDTSHLTITPADGVWEPFAPGVRIKRLHQQGDLLSYLLHFAAGACLPPHRHRADEECVVLEGRLRLGSRVEVGPGSYHLARAGALHATLKAPEGALVFLRGAVPRADDVLA